eukprot:gb/GFBE01022420.1/.p1 GENE.gb/GFBE01022420.1/~~gb/GFBE01022420.1/.p1  ORF type:complete len:113 (+),score=18.23 gb/GFBE01022420.1/:1-339(+)
MADVVKAAFHALDENGDGILDFEEFQPYFDFLRFWDDRSRTFSRLCSGGSGIDPARFREIVKNTTGIICDGNYLSDSEVESLTQALETRVEIRITKLSGEPFFGPKKVDRGL